MTSIPIDNNKKGGLALSIYLKQRRGASLTAHSPVYQTGSFKLMLALLERVWKFGLQVKISRFSLNQGTEPGV